MVSGLLKPIEEQLTNLRFDLLSTPARGELVVVEIDAKSMQRLPVWPWPRSYYATAVARLADAGVARIGFDVDFSAESPSDSAFESVLRQHPYKVVLPTFVQTAHDHSELTAIVSEPIPRFAQYTQQASVNVFPDYAGRVETYQTAVTMNDRRRPSLGAVLAGSNIYSFETFTIDYAIEPSTLPRLSFVDALNGDFDAAQLAGKTIVIGATSIELGDRYVVPRHGVQPGVVVQALAAETLAQGRALHNVPTAGVMMLMVLSLVLRRLVQKNLSFGLRLVSCFFFIVLLFSTALVLQTNLHILLPIAPFVVLVLLLNVVNLIGELRTRTRLFRSERRSNERRRLLFEQVVASSSAAIVVTDKYGNVQSFNHVAVSMLNIGSEEDYTISDLIPDFDACFPGFINPGEEQEPGDVQKFLNAETQLHSAVFGDIDVEIIGNRSVGEYIEGNDPLSDEVVISFTIRNITERKQAERAREDALKASEAANRTKTQFIANMSHELRTPLNAVIGFSDILKEQPYGPMGVPQYVEFAHDINSAGRHLLGLLNNLLDASRIELGHLKLSEGHVVLSELVASSISIIKSSPVADDRLNISAHIDESLEVLADPRLLKQCLLNLLSNAAKFTENDGTISVAATLRPDGTLDISVTDDGIGIPADQLDIVGHAFHQVETQLDRTNDGAGLGLYLVTQYLQLHGGHIEIESTVGRGTTVHLILPSERVDRHAPALEDAV